MKKPPSKLETDAETAVDRQDTVDCLDAFEKEQMRARPILKWEVGLILPIVLFYVSAWGYMIVEVFVSLRALPLGVYETFDLADIPPHW